MTNLTEPLRRAALYRFLALSFMPPTTQRNLEIAALIPEIDAPLQEGAASLVLERKRDDLEGLYHLLIGAQKNVRCCETDYLQEAAGNKGAVLGDIAGFFRAFGFEADSEMKDVPDHIAIELSFLSFLAFKEGFALHREDLEQIEICREGERKFLSEHLDRWFHRFSGSLASATRDGYYCSLALFADCTLGPLLAAAREKAASLHEGHRGHAECEAVTDVEGCLGCFHSNDE